jgi:pilus assembly protein Flp/PilA
MNVAKQLIHRLAGDTDAAVFVEYLLLLTIVGIGAIAGLAAVRGALINELLELAAAIAALV